jgi:hypothetical protein
MVSESINSRGIMRGNKFIRDKLENWARWSQQKELGGLGYPKQSAFARMGAASGRTESVVPLDNLDASETQDAVESLRFTQSGLHMVLVLTYAKGLPRQRVARLMSCEEITIKANLLRAECALARWFEDRDAVRKKKLEANLV